MDKTFYAPKINMHGHGQHALIIQKIDVSITMAYPNSISFLNSE